jgi:hypothetical protein
MTVRQAQGHPERSRGVTIDQELRAALDVEPSPEFVARVRTRIATKPAPRGWRIWSLVAAAAAVAAVVLAALLVSPPATVVNPQAPPLLESRRLPLASAPSVVPPKWRVDEPVVKVARAKPESEVVIDGAEANALRRLVFGPPLNIDQPYVGTTLAAIEITPLSIEPLPIGGEGVRQ